MSSTTKDQSVELPKDQQAASSSEATGAKSLFKKLDDPRQSRGSSNYHTEDQVRLLARNIKRYGLRNPVELKQAAEDDDHLYEIIAGEGRYLAFCHLRDTEGSTEWNHIPATVRDEAADAGMVCGTRVSENALRWFNWGAECMETATLRATEPSSLLVPTSNIRSSVRPTASSLSLSGEIASPRSNSMSSFTNAWGRRNRGLLPDRASSTGPARFGRHLPLVWGHTVYQPPPPDPIYEHTPI